MRRNFFEKILVTVTVLAPLVMSCSEKDIPGAAVPGDDKTSSDQISYTVSPPGIVIDYSPASTQLYLGSPSIAVLDDGAYVASHDGFGDGSVGYQSTTYIFRSEDKGKTWVHTANVQPMTWGKLFVFGGNLYLMGMESGLRSCVLVKSEDGGKSWSDAQKILGWRCHSSSVPVVQYNGRLWRGLEVKNPDINTWPQQFNAMMFSISVDDNLEDPSKWTRSNQLEYNSMYLDGFFQGWLEGNAVPGPDGSMKLVMRVQIPNSINGEKIAIIDVSDDGKTISFDPETGFATMPGGAKKFCIRYDDESKRYWVLSNYVGPEYASKNPAEIRNSLALCSSSDLRNWVVHKIILHSDDYEKTGFQYVDWQVDNDDIVLVSRTAYEDGNGGASSAHDNNFFTFHRVSHFRNLLNENIDTE